jgi:lipopolysaccharide biosynthesis glycosyltransferase
MIHIAATCDANYAMPLAVMLASLAANLAPHRIVTVHILESGLDATTRQKVEHSVKGRRIVLRWTTVAGDRLSSLRQTLRSFDTVSLAGYYRLLLPEAVPADIDKLIYLDCDLVIRRDIGALWDIDVGGVALLAVPELSKVAQFVSSPEGVRRHSDIGLADDQLQFNSGVMVINLRVWRDELVPLRAFAYLGAAGREVRWHDQEALNVVTAKSWHPLDSRWNVTMHAFRGAADAEQAKQLLAEAFIVHFNSARKPWQAGFPYGFKSLFEHYLDSTAWAGMRPVRGSPLQLLANRLVRALLKRCDRASRVSQTLLRRGRAWFSLPLAWVDAEPPSTSSEIRLFVIGGVGLETANRITEELARGANRAIVLCTAAGARMVGPAPHVHRVIVGPSDQKTTHKRLYHLLRRYGTGHWCVVLSGNETLRFPGEERTSLRGVRDAMASEGADALLCRVNGEGAVVRISSFAADPLTGRTMIAPALVEIRDDGPEYLEWRSRIVMLRVRAGLEIAEDLRAVRGAKLATVEGVLQR